MRLSKEKNNVIFYVINFVERGYKLLKLLSSIRQFFL